MDSTNDERKKLQAQQMREWCSAMIEEKNTAAATELDADRCALGLNKSVLVGALAHRGKLTVSYDRLAIACVDVGTTTRCKATSQQT
eukprot:SAG31_NODE_326_length_17664_cov_10.038543_20_plen_87_part_00